MKDGAKWLTRWTTSVQNSLITNYWCELLATNPLQEAGCGATWFSSMLKQLVKFHDEFHNNIIWKTLISKYPDTRRGPKHQNNEFVAQHESLTTNNAIPQNIVTYNTIPRSSCSTSIVTITINMDVQRLWDKI